MVRGELGPRRRVLPSVFASVVGCMFPTSVFICVLLCATFSLFFIHSSVFLCRGKKERTKTSVSVLVCVAIGVLICVAACVASSRIPACRPLYINQ